MNKTWADLWKDNESQHKTRRLEIIRTCLIEKQWRFNETARTLGVAPNTIKGIMQSDIQLWNEYLEHRKLYRKHYGTAKNNTHM